MTRRKNNKKLKKSIDKQKTLWYNSLCCWTNRKHNIRGEMSEWLKEPVLKTGDGSAVRGFESRSLLHFFRLWRSTQEAEEAPLLRV